MDFWETLYQQLNESGFFLLEEEGARIYYRQENPIFYLVCFLDQADSVYEKKDAIFTEYARDMLERVRDMQCTRMVALSILVDNRDVDRPVDIVDNVEKGKNAKKTETEISFYEAEQSFFRLYWTFSPQKGVSAGHGQPDKLLGIEKLLAAAARREMPEELPLRDEADGKPIVTMALLLSWLILLGWMTFSGRRGDIIAAYGLSRAGILAGEYYRFLTAMFLHSGLLHLASNGIYLYCFGRRAELLLGRGRFLLLYLASGLCGGLCSIALGGGLGIGASGAIFGILGAMLMLTRKRGARVTGINYSTMLLLAVSALGIGFFDPHIDNFAHIGGFIGGIAVFWLMMRRK